MVEHDGTVQKKTSWKRRFAIFLGVAVFATQVPWVDSYIPGMVKFDPCFQGYRYVRGPIVDSVLMPAKLVAVFPVGAENFELHDFSVTDNLNNYDIGGYDSKGQLDHLLFKSNFPNVWFAPGEQKNLVLWIKQIDVTKPATIASVNLLFISPLGIPYWASFSDTAMVSVDACTAESDQVPL